MPPQRPAASLVHRRHEATKYLSSEDEIPPGAQTPTADSKGAKRRHYRAPCTQKGRTSNAKLSSCAAGKQGATSHRTTQSALSTCACVCVVGYPCPRSVQKVALANRKLARLALCLSISGKGKLWALPSGVLTEKACTALGNGGIAAQARSDTVGGAICSSPFPSATGTDPLDSRMVPSLGVSAGDRGC